ncbi:MAG: Uma2 family endonuclease [Chloroflexi bacterium]|nr:Uma2 family endonuclease [Chloroflexota bacterium]
MVAVQASVTRRRFTVEDYERMVAAGILEEDDRVELIEGDIIEMAAAGGRHIWCVVRLTNWLGTHLSGRALVSVQNPIRLSRHSEPEPDIALLRLPSGPSSDDVPAANQVLLLIEVADTSLAHDRQTKLPLYAVAGIPEVWIVDLGSGRIEVYRQPVDGSYSVTTAHGRDDVIAPLAFPDLAIPCAEILPTA